MKENTPRSDAQSSIEAAVEAYRHGYMPVPIRTGTKRPFGAQWTHYRWESEESVREAFEGFTENGATNLGLMLGEPSGGLIDIDLDHPKALRLRDYFLPPSPMQTGRAGRPKSHRWYIVRENLPGTRRYTMPDKSVIIELRSTGAQTLVPPSIWHPKLANGPTEAYRWEGSPWGGKKGPAVVDGSKLAVQVALLALGALLLERWPARGSRHEAYLALAGGLLRFGDGVHPYWERNLPVLIEALARATNDDDGPDARIAEVMGTTITRLREGGKAVGFGKLSELIGDDFIDKVKQQAKEVESLAGFKGEPIVRLDATGAVVPSLPLEPVEEMPVTLDRNPMEERISSWAAVDLEPYLYGRVSLPPPSILCRTDGKGVFYPGRVNSLFGLSESAKSWLALTACIQEMDKGERAMYIDFEDEPVGTIDRARALGAGTDDLASQLRYVHPEGPLADMQRYRFGHAPTDEGRASASVFRALLESYDPTIIIADGMTALYGLHGHDTNEATATDVITTWLKALCRFGRTTVIVIDHTGKGGGAGSSPIGAHHKVAMVQGTAIRVDVVERPRRGGVGRMRLIVFKDRIGSVREYAVSTGGSEDIAADVTMDSTTRGVTRMLIEPPDPDDVVIGDSDRMNEKLAQLARNAELQTNIINLFGGDIDMELTTGDIEREFGVANVEVYDAWAALKSGGYVEQIGVNRWTKYRLARPEGTPEKDTKEEQ